METVKINAFELGNYVEKFQSLFGELVEVAKRLPFEAEKRDIHSIMESMRSTALEVMTRRGELISFEPDTVAETGGG